MTSGQTLGPLGPLLSGYLHSFAGVRRPAREIDYLSPYSAEVKNGWNCTSTVPNTFMEWTAENWSRLRYVGK